MQCFVTGHLPTAGHLPSAPNNGYGPSERNPVRTKASFDLMGHMFSFCWADPPITATADICHGYVEGLEI